jgi:O-Antigen ligase
MNQAVIALIFVLSFGITLLGGAGLAFAVVYLPAAILFSQLPEVAIPHAPVAAHFAPLYGIILGLPFRSEPIKFKWCILDTIMILLLISVTITAWSTELFETGVNAFRTDLLTWFGPYFVARMVFRSIATRRAALNMLIILIAIISVAALIEFRLQPYWYLHMLKDIGMRNRIPPMAYERYGFFRVSGPLIHPIYFGNMCLILIGMIAILAKTTGKNLKNIWVALGMLGALGCLVTSISFTPYVGLFASTAFFVVLMTVPRARQLVLPLTLFVFGGIFFFTYHVAHEPLGAKPDGDLPGSLWTRKMIINESWKKAATAPLFGYGRILDFSNDADFDLDSVDNSYLQFAMTRGLIYTALWVSIGIFFSIRMTKAFNLATHPSQIFPLSVATAVVLGVMVSMYTVWAGAQYTVIWMVLLGLSNTLIDLVLYPNLLLVPTRVAVTRTTSLTASAPAILQPRALDGR